jgi:hypothetical protein
MPVDLVIDYTYPKELDKAAVFAFSYWSAIGAPMKHAAEAAIAATRVAEIARHGPRHDRKRRNIAATSAKSDCTLSVRPKWRRDV